MSAKSFAVRIFLADGTVDGVKIIAKSKWPGRAIVIPRTLFAEEKTRAELNAPGLYVLISPLQNDELPTLMIGSADPICDQLEQHDAETDFWSWAVTFTAKKDQLKPAYIVYIKTRLIQLAQEVKKAKLVNSIVPEFPMLSEEEEAEAESFLAHMLSICPVIGLSIFEMPNALNARMPKSRHF